MRNFIYCILAIFAFCFIACSLGTNNNGSTSQYVSTNVGNAYQFSLPKGMTKLASPCIEAHNMWEKEDSHLSIDVSTEQNIKDEYANQIQRHRPKVGIWEIIQESDSFVYSQSGRTMYLALVQKELNGLFFYVTYTGYGVSLEETQKIASSITFISDFYEQVVSNDGFVTYTTPYYEVSYPIDWILYEYPSYYIQDFYSGKESESIGFTLSRTEKKIPLSEAISRQMGDVKYSVTTKKITINNTTAYKSTVCYNGKNGDSEDYIFNFYVDDVLYTLRFACSPNKADKYQDIFDKIIKSLKVKSSSKSRDNEFKTYATQYYEISYPSDWQFVPLPKEQGDFYAGHKYEKIGFSIMRIDMSMEAEYVHLDEVVSRIIDGSKSAGFRTTKQRTSINGKTAYKIITTGNDGFGNFKKYTYYFFAGDVLYILQFGNDPNKVDKYQDTFDKIIKSLKVRK